MAEQHQGAAVDAAKVARLERLHQLLKKNAGAYYRAADSRRDPSRRLFGWMDEYDAHRHTPEWAEFCRRQGFAQTHRATDVFA